VFNFCDSHLKRNYLIKIVVLLLIFMTVRIPEAQATSAVQVQSISATSGTYSVGQTLNITLTFSANVKIKGRFSLVLETGPTDRTVGCSDTACQNVGVEFTTNTITFPYTVRHGDRASDLNYQSTAALLLTPNWPSNSEKFFVWYK
jgi:predicted S18 family serine protease